MRPSISFLLVCTTFNNTTITALNSFFCQSIDLRDCDVILVFADLLSVQACSDFLLEYSLNRSLPVRCQTLHNPNGTLASGWNIGILASDKEYVLRVDSHAYLSPDYVEEIFSANLFLKGNTAGVGGSLLTINRGSLLDFRENILRYFLSSPFMVGPSFRTISSRGIKSKYLRTRTSVYAVYRRQILVDVGFLDECLLRSQDLDLHARLHKSGFLLYTVTNARSVYQPNPSLLFNMIKAFKNGYFPQRYGVALSRHSFMAFYGLLLFALAFVRVDVFCILLLTHLFTCVLTGLFVGRSLYEKAIFPIYAFSCHILNVAGAVLGVSAFFCFNKFRTVSIVSCK